MGHVPWGRRSSLWQSGLPALRPSGAEDTEEASAPMRIRSHDEYLVWIHAAIISSHICMEIRFAAFYRCSHTHVCVWVWERWWGPERLSKSSNTVSGTQVSYFTTKREHTLKQSPHLPVFLWVEGHHQEAVCHVSTVLTALLHGSFPLERLYTTSLLFVTINPLCRYLLYVSSYCHCSVTNNNRCSSATALEELTANRCFNPIQIYITKEAHANLISHTSQQTDWI